MSAGTETVSLDEQKSPVNVNIKLSLKSQFDFIMFVKTRFRN